MAYRARHAVRRLGRIESRGLEVGKYLGGSPGDSRLRVRDGRMARRALILDLSVGGSMIDGLPAHVGEPIGVVGGVCHQRDAPIGADR